MHEGKGLCDVAHAREGSHLDGRQPDARAHVDAVHRRGGDGGQADGVVRGGGVVGGVAVVGDAREERRNQDYARHVKHLKRKIEPREGVKVTVARWVWHVHLR
jgi:hypothetical protein